MGRRITCDRVKLARDAQRGVDGLAQIVRVAAVAERLDQRRGGQRHAKRFPVEGAGHHVLVHHGPRHLADVAEVRENFRPRAPNNLDPGAAGSLLCQWLFLGGWNVSRNRCLPRGG